MNKYELATILSNSNRYSGRPDIEWFMKWRKAELESALIQLNDGIDAQKDQDYYEDNWSMRMKLVN